MLASLFLFVKVCLEGGVKLQMCYDDGGLDLSLQYNFKKEVITDNLRGTKFQT